MNIPGKSPFGSIESGVLIAEASATTATFHIIDQYIDYPETDPYKASFAMSIDDLSLEDCATMQLPFYPDYLLNLDGPDRLYDGAELTLLLVHPDVSLVLRRKLHDDKYVTIQGEQPWERIGIARQADFLHLRTAVNWMAGSEVKTFTIV